MARLNWIKIASGRIGCWQHQAIIWANDVMYSDIHLRAILQEIIQLLIMKISLKMPFIKFCSIFLKANELIAKLEVYQLSS